MSANQSSNATTDIQQARGTQQSQHLRVHTRWLPLIAVFVLPGCHRSTPLTAGEVTLQDPAAVAAEPIQPTEPADASPEPSQPPVSEDPPPDPEPDPYRAEPVRTEGDLTVHTPPRKPTSDFQGRLRTHTEGSLSKGSPRVWIGPKVPGFVALMKPPMELFLLDHVGDEFMAFYREPYGAGKCNAGGVSNCSYFARLYDTSGAERWGVDLDEQLSRTTELEIQDIRYADGTLYFNEACQGYSSGAKGKCSALVAYDPAAGETRWRTRNLVSNGEFLIHGDYIISGYGFTGERDYVFIVRRSDGKIMHKVSVKTAAQSFTLTEDGLLEARLYSGRALFELRGWDGNKPKLIRTKRKPSRARTTVSRSSG